jgi:hypothetical protein
MKRMVMAAGLAIAACLFAAKVSALSPDLVPPSSSAVTAPSASIAELADSDGDGDGVFNSEDNCPYDYNPKEAVEVDDDFVGPPEFKQPDADDDGVGDACDLCAGTAADVSVDSDGCEVDECLPGDSDCDGVIDSEDNCPDVPNPKQYPAWDGPAVQWDTDNDGVGDECDVCPEDPIASHQLASL